MLDQTLLSSLECTERTNRTKEEAGSKQSRVNANSGAEGSLVHQRSDSVLWKLGLPGVRQDQEVVGKLGWDMAGKAAHCIPVASTVTRSQSNRGFLFSQFSE